MILLAGWGRAILLQLAHPLVAQGVAAHSDFLAEGWGRLWRLSRTLSAMLTLTFGTPEEVAAVARAINGIHDRVNGQLAVGQGPFPAHTRYTAHDPALLAWVHATLVDSLLLAYERFVAPLTAEERDRYCAESTGIAPLLGIPPNYLPASVAELAAYMDAMLAGGEVAVTDTARALGREVVNPPAFLIGRPIVALARLPTVGLLPAGVREAYGFRWSARHQRALDGLAATSRRLLPVLPSALRHWPAARAARVRSAPRRAG